MEPITRRSGRRLARDLALLALAGVLLAVGAFFGYNLLYKNVYGPGAFVENYLTLLSEGRAADALVVPGVSVDSVELEEAGIDPMASDALLRRDALAPLTNIKIVSERTDGDLVMVTASYTAGGVNGSTTFAVTSNGWQGLAPGWKFARTPLGVIDLTVFGSMTYSINGFDLDKRQVSVDGIDAAPSDAVPMLVFSPGLYSVAVDTAISTASGTAVLADVPLTSVPVVVQTLPTDEFVQVIQDRVNDFLTTQCASQQVLQPTNCPFGITVQNRIANLPVWTISQPPVITVAPDGSNWRIPEVSAVATVTVEMKSLYDGSIWERVEEVPFTMSGTILMTPDGQASISITSVDIR